ncbi:MAG: hypothetical protein H6605_06755 [Flavobacteriales bacterium]|nr:hypothetical protein [Flavobacteriales bacterium]
MNNKILLYLVLLLVTSCKYEDGPAISLRTKKHRAVNTWFLDKAFENNVDKTSAYQNAFNNYKIQLDKDNRYQLSYKAFNLIPYSESGSWDFNQSKTNINFTPEGGKGSSSWKILMLKEHETRVVQNIDGKDVELWLKD